MQQQAPQLETTTLYKIYLYFRLLIGLLLGTLHFVSQAHDSLGKLEPTAFRYTLLIYGIVALLTFVITPAHELRHKHKTLIAYLILDITTVVLLVHTSGGLASGLGYLLLVYVAMSSIFLREKWGIFFAAFASALVIFDTIYLAVIGHVTSSSIFSSGVLGILLFVTTLAIQFFTRKIEESAADAAAQAEYAENLKQLAQAIITRMRTGVIVVDQQGQIELINDSALQLMDLPGHGDYRKKMLDDVSPMQKTLAAWSNSNQSGSQVHQLPHGQEVRISLANLDIGENPRTVFYLEDNRALIQQAQQLKLASLGRLTANIAHEVRNPLGAIAHAAQLLAESETIDKGDKRLTDIILQHSDRVNQIIENTLVLSRRKEPQLHVVDLQTWLPHFINEYTAGNNHKIVFNAPSQSLQVRADTTHLSQILTNLCDNGARYSEMATGEPLVYLIASHRSSDSTAYIEVVDNGPGVPDEKIDLIFDPFYTTDVRGSGLGLYISKELCEISQANLYYKRTDDEKSCFRIDFAHHQRES